MAIKLKIAKMPIKSKYEKLMKIIEYSGYLWV